MNYYISIINFILKGKNQAGQAAIVMVFVLGMTALMLALAFSTSSVTNVQISDNSYSSKKAFYAAQAGVEDLLIRLKQNQNLGESPYNTGMINFDNTYYIATISAPVPGERVVRAEGNYKNFVKKIEVELNTSTNQTSFNSAVQTDSGGFELESNSRIMCKAPCVEGKVYSNGDIKGVKKSPISSASRISGSVYAHGVITKLGNNDTGVWIEREASAAGLLYCKVDGDQASLAAESSVDCPLVAGRSYHQISEPPPIVPLPAFNTIFWQNQATNSAIGGGEFSGNCVVLSGGADDCTGGTGVLGPKKIVGNLTVLSNRNLTVKGPIWVTGNVDIASNNSIILDPSFINYGTVVLVDGNIISGTNVVYTQNGTAVIMMTSTKDDGQNCSLAAISVGSNSNNVIFYALNGCVNISANSSFHGSVVGQKVHVGGNSTIEYDPALAQAVFGSSCVGGWAISDWKEID